LSIENIKDRVGITAYFNDQTSEREIPNVKAEIELLPNVEHVEYIPKTAAPDLFMELHKNQPLHPETLNEFNDEENPLPNSFAIKARALGDYRPIAETLNSDRYAPYFERIRDNSKVIDRLYDITNGIKNLGIVLTAVFVVVTVMVM